MWISHSHGSIRSGYNGNIFWLVGDMVRYVELRSQLSQDHVATYNQHHIISSTSLHGRLTLLPVWLQSVWVSLLLQLKPDLPAVILWDFHWNANISESGQQLSTSSTCRQQQHTHASFYCLLHSSNSSRLTLESLRSHRSISVTFSRNWSRWHHKRMTCHWLATGQNRRHFAEQTQINPATTCTVPVPTPSVRHYLLIQSERTETTVLVLMSQNHQCEQSNSGLVVGEVKITDCQCSEFNVNGWVNYCKHISSMKSLVIYFKRFSSKTNAFFLSQKLPIPNWLLYSYWRVFVCPLYCMLWRRFACHQVIFGCWIILWIGLYIRSLVWQKVSVRSLLSYMLDCIMWKTW